MSRRCDLNGKTAQVGHRVSHSNIKTKRRFLPNLLNVTLISDALGRSVRLRISANALRTVDHRGGLDAFLLKAKDDDISKQALELKRQIRKARGGSASSAKVLLIDKRDRAAIIAGAVMADADREQLDRRARLNVVKHPAEKAFKIVA